MKVLVTGAPGRPERTPCDETCNPRPVGDYGRSKLEAEAVCRRFMSRGLKVNIIRPRFIVGEGRLGLLTILFDWVSRGKRIYIIGDGQNRFQMIENREHLKSEMSADFPAQGLLKLLRFFS